MLNGDFNNVTKQLIEFTLWRPCSPVNLQHIFRTFFPKNTSRRMLLTILIVSCREL